MLRSYLTLLAVLFFSSSFAQEGESHQKHRIYVCAGVKYGFPFDTKIEIDGNLISGAQHYGYNMYSYSADKVSFGKGAKLSAGVGFMFHPNFGFEVSVISDLGAKKYEARFSQNGPNSSAEWTVNTHSKGQTYLVSALIIQVPVQPITTYVRLGVALPTAGKIIQETNFTSSVMGSVSAYNANAEITTRFAAGINGAIGLKLPLTKHIGCWAEAFGTVHNAYAKRYKQTRLIENGVEQTPTASKTYSFSDEGPSPDPQTFLIPYSNFGFGVGASFAL
jgi:hypothetical protein